MERGEQSDFNLRLIYMKTNPFRLVFWFTLCAVLMAACGAVPPVTPRPSPAPTSSPTPTQFLPNPASPTPGTLPTFLPLPSVTLAPTFTAIPSFTPMASLTPRPRATSTPNPTQRPTRTRTPRPALTKTPAPSPTITPHATLTTSLKGPAVRQGIAIGAWLARIPLRTDPNYAPTFLSQFNMATISHFQWDLIQPAQGQYNFAATDALVNFARKNNLKIRAYALVSDADLPAWLRNGKFTEQQSRALLQNYITTVVNRYRGKIDSWVVVSQAMSETGQWKKSYWFQAIGPEYISLAFQWAHQADPKAHFYYADSDLARANPKSAAILKWLKSLKNQKIPVDGISLQFNITLGTPLTQKQIQDALRQYAQLGLDIQLAEVSVRVWKPITAEKLTRQAARYQLLMNACLAVTRCKAFLLWGFTDAYPISPSLYPKQGSAFLFDANYQPKPAYFAIYRALQTP
jgi:endo-1,4-beta-xylanase